MRKSGSRHSVSRDGAATVGLGISRPGLFAETLLRMESRSASEKDLNVRLLASQPRGEGDGQAPPKTANFLHCLEWIGGGSQLRDLGCQIATLHQLGIALADLERGQAALAPEADVELVLAEPDGVNGEIGQPWRQRRIDIEFAARRIRQKAQ